MTTHTKPFLVFFPADLQDAMVGQLKRLGMGRAEYLRGLVLADLPRDVRKTIRPAPTPGRPKKVRK